MTEVQYVGFVLEDLFPLVGERVCDRVPQEHRARAFWQHDVPQTFENVHRKAAQQRAWAWQFWEVCVLLRSVRFGFWIGLQDLQESFVWCCHPLLGDELQV